MTHSVINITCSNCTVKFIGVLHDLLNISKNTQQHALLATSKLLLKIEQQ